MSRTPRSKSPPPPKPRAAVVAPREAPAPWLSGGTAGIRFGVVIVRRRLAPLRPPAVAWATPARAPEPAPTPDVGAIMRLAYLGDDGPHSALAHARALQALVTASERVRVALRDAQTPALASAGGAR